MLCLSLLFKQVWRCYQ